MYYAAVHASLLRVRKETAPMWHTFIALIAATGLTAAALVYSVGSPDPAPRTAEVQFSRG
jgi:hypothetical protein